MERKQAAYQLSSVWRHSARTSTQSLSTSSPKVHCSPLKATSNQTSGQTSRARSTVALSLSPTSSIPLWTRKSLLLTMLSIRSRKRRRNNFFSLSIKAASVALSFFKQSSFYTPRFFFIHVNVALYTRLVRLGIKGVGYGGILDGCH